MSALCDSKSKSIDDRGIHTLLTREAKLESWLLVEKCLAKAEADAGIIPRWAAESIVENGKLCNMDLEEMEQIQERIGHGFVPFLKVMVKACGDSGKYIHFGVTTQNIQQTAQLYLIKQIHEIFKDFIADILRNLAILAREHANTVMAGRTHGKHAVPITYGYKIAGYISELLSSAERMEECEKRVFQVMMGGAVGSFNALGKAGIQVQENIARQLDMISMPVANRNIYSHKTEYIMNLALLCNVCHRMANEVYYTGIEEFNEVSEAFQAGTIGSSTMPQKINPKLAKGIVANAEKLNSLVNLALNSSIRMFEGSSSGYMVSENILFEAVELCTEVLIRMEAMTKTLHVNKERMYQNALLSKGLINSENVMMHVAEKMGKDAAHELLYDKAMMVEIEGKDYLTVLKEDPIVSSLFTDSEIEEMIKPESYIGIGAVIAKEMANKALQKAAIIKNSTLQIPTK